MGRGGGCIELPLSVCLCVCVCVLVRPCIPFFVRSISSTFKNKFQKKLHTRVPFNNSSVMRKVCFDTPKVKVTVEGQTIKLTLFAT